MNEGVVCHVVCANPEAHRELLELCRKWGNKMFVDWEQSKLSYDAETKYTSKEVCGTSLKQTGATPHNA